MTLDEAIKHHLESADYLDHDAGLWNRSAKFWGSDNTHAFDKAKECRRRAKEHRQIAEWLKELKQYRELFDSPEEASFVRTTFYEGGLN